MRIDGKAISQEILDDLSQRVRKLKQQNITPHLAIILVGDNPVSKSYVSQKQLKAEEIGAKTTLIHKDANVQNEELIEIIKQLNNDNSIHGVIVQRPLPPQMNVSQIAQAIDAKKDVDGLHPNSGFVMPLAASVLRILEEVSPRPLTSWLLGKNIVVIGKGETGGSAVIQLLRKMGANPKVIDSKTENPKAIMQSADVIISAVGKANIVKPHMVKKGVILISVGLHRETDGKIHGDYEEEKMESIASFYTPSPGGVGPVNVAMLLKNLVEAAETP